MKLLHIIEHLNTGGEERLLVGLVNELARQHPTYQQCLVTLKGGELLASIDSEHVTIVSYENVTTYRRLFKLVSLIQTMQPDIIHTRLSSAGYWGRTAALLARSNALCIQGHGGDTFCDASLKRYILEKLLAFRTQAHICVSESVRQHLLHNGFEKKELAVIHNGICSSWITKRGTTPFSIPPRLICIGRLERIKGQDVLLDAVAKIHEAGFTFSLDCVGCGSMRQQLEQQAIALGISQYVNFTGNSPNISQQLGSYDIYVQASRSEGLSLALIEALMTGMPVVATDVGDSQQLCSTYGITVPPSNPQALAAAIIHVLRNPQEALERAQHAPKALQAYTMSEVARQYARFFEQRLHKKR